MLRKLGRSAHSLKRMNLIVDTDCGLDDIFALSLLDSVSKVHISCISTVNGLNSVVGGAKTVAILFRSSAFVNRPTIVRGLTSLPDNSKLCGISWLADYLHSLHNIEDAIHMNLTGGCSIETDIEARCESLAVHLQELHRPQTTLEQQSDGPAENVLLCLGPLTNIGALLKAQPDALSRSVSRVVIMGGAVNTPGNCAHGAEFNFFLDPQAAHEVIHHCGVPVELISLDVANSEAFTPADVSSKASSITVFHSAEQNQVNCATSFLTTLQFMQYLYKEFPDCACYDAVAAYYVANKDAFVLKDVRVYVDPRTGVVHNMSNMDTDTRCEHHDEMLQSSVVIKTATEFDRNKYVEYIRHLLAM